MDSPAQRRILLVDDDPLLAGLVAPIVATAGFGMIPAGSVAECLQLLDGLGEEQPAALVVDLFMPEASGFDLMRSLAARNCKTPVIIVTGVDQHYLGVAEEFARIWGLNVLGSMMKPLSSDRLTLLVRTLLRAQETALEKAVKPVILVADDDALVRELMVHAFLDSGFEVLEAENGAQALERIRERDRLDVLLTDVDMPVMNGIALALAVEKMRPRAAIVFTSGKIVDPPMAHAVFVPKPFRPRELVDVVRSSVTN